MAESAVLFHSYSFAAPLSRNEESLQDNPIHALSQSISFGRFMTEDLEWGKWSSFLHKKYVDEAEKFSQPGSVAQKKAFFEAHYKKKIADAKKANDSDESSDPKQQPESVAVLLNTLETLTKDEEVKEEEHIDETDLVLSNEKSVLSIEKDEEPGRKSVAVLKQEDVLVDNSLDKPLVADDLQGVHDEMEEKETFKEDGELLKKSSSVGEKEEERKSVSKNSPVFSLSMEKSATSEVPEKAMELVFSQKISERSVTHSSMKKSENPVRQRFSFLSCLMGNTKTQDQNTTRKKRKTDKKPNKSFLCLCFKPEMVGETEAPIKTQRKNL